MIVMLYIIFYDIDKMRMYSRLFIARISNIYCGRSLYITQLGDVTCEIYKNRLLFFIHKLRSCLWMKLLHGSDLNFNVTRNLIRLSCDKRLKLTDSALDNVCKFTTWPITHAHIWYNDSIFGLSVTSWC